MNRVKFIDRVAQGKISRRRLLGAAAAFGVGALVVPTRARADEVLTCMEWSGYDQAAFFKSGPMQTMPWLAIPKPRPRWRWRCST